MDVHKFMDLVGKLNMPCFGQYNFLKFLTCTVACKRQYKLKISTNLVRYCTLVILQLATVKKSTQD